MKAITIILGSALITGAALKAVPALAETPSHQSNVAVSIVRTADLDLTKADGQRQLDRRLAAAAREVCGVASDVDLEGKNDVRKCRDDVLAKANAQRDQLVAAAGRGAEIAIAAAR
jgi:UrcA family protein